MGQNCTCFVKSGDGVSEKYRIRPLVTFSQTAGHQIFDTQEKSQNNPDEEFCKTPNSGANAIATNLNKRIRGYLFRKYYKTFLKDNLVSFANELYTSFVNEKSYNKNVIDVQIKYQNEKYDQSGWTKYYSVSPMPPTDTTQKEIIFSDRILITYATPHSRGYETKYDILNNMSSLYRGSVKYPNLKHGKGSLTYLDGTVYKGFWDNDKFSGWNLWINTKGIMYIGLFSDYHLNGKGERYTLENRIYKGDFVGSRREGYGVEISDKLRYEGEFKDDKQNGQAKVTFSNGDTYEGNVVNGVFEGKGHYIWEKTGYEYIGEYKNGKFSGKGFYKLGENEYFKGEYKDGVKEGQGEMVFADGKKYIGPFSQGKPHGVGYFENGKDFKGEAEFYYGKLNKNYHPSQT